MANITEEMLIELGFRKVEGSVKPTYFDHPSFFHHTIGFHENKAGHRQWAFYIMPEGSDCAEMDLIVSSLFDVISYVATHSFQMGKKARSKEIKKLLDF